MRAARPHTPRKGQRPLTPNVPLDKVFLSFWFVTRNVIVPRLEIRKRNFLPRSGVGFCEKKLSQESFLFQFLKD
jgi:hypothetical protein